MINYNWDKAGIDISKVRGGKAFCPQCHDTRKNKSDRSLSVNITEGVYNCHNCGNKGSVREYPKKKEYVKPVPRLTKLSPRTLEWFENTRKISNNTLLRFNVTEAREWMPQYQTEVTVICFNYMRDGELVNIKFRGPKKSFKMQKDAELIFYNIDSIENEKECFIVEGEIDSLSMYEAGIFNCVSVPNGASAGNSRLEYLDNCYDAFEKCEKIVICTDGDGPGIALKDELIRRLGAERCWTVKYPEGCKDANDILVKYGKEQLKQFAQSATQMPVDGIETVFDCIDDVDSLYNNGYPTADKIGWRGVDDVISWKKGDLYVITGTPNSGKSTWLNNVFVRLADEHKWRFCLFSPEKSPTSFLIAELCEIRTGKPFYRRDPSEKIDPIELNRSLSFVHDNFFFHKINTTEKTLDYILEKSAEVVRRYGVNAILIDPWNYVEHQIPHGYTETQYVSEALTKIKRFKDIYGCAVFIVAHPTKLRKNKDTNEYEVPTLYDISGSAHFFNKADNGIVIVRNYNERTTSVYVQKIRWFFVGKVGEAKMVYDVESKRFRDTEGDDRWLPPPIKAFESINGGYARLPYKEPEDVFDDTDLELV